MKNPNTFLTKDGVSDADLLRASRDLYEAADWVINDANNRGRQHIRLAALNALAAALAKVHGDI